MAALTWHPFAEKFPPIEGAEWEAFKASIAASGGNDETVKYRMVNGRRQFLDGKNRDRACQELHLECKMEQVDVPDDQVKDYILRRNVHRRHMTVEMRRAIVAELRADGESVRQIADAVGVSKSTVHSDIQTNERADSPGVQNRTPGESEGGNVLGADGKTYPAKKPPPVIDAAGKPLCSKCQRLGPTKDCPQCADLAKPPPAYEKPAPRKRSGQVLFDWKKFDDSHFGPTVRDVDALANAYGGEKQSKEYAECVRLLTEFRRTWEQWHERLTGATNA